MNSYSTGIMFNSQFRHHDIKTGKPTTKLLDLKGNHLPNQDANLFYPTKKGLVVVEFLNGEMTAYAYLVANENNEVVLEPKKPYGTLIKVKNELQIPKNVLESNTHLFATGDTSWFIWKALINSNDITKTENYIFPTITTSQERIPNAGMVIYGEKSFMKGANNE